MGSLGPAAGLGTPPAPALGNNGLRFINEAWNGSIANGESLTLRWNETVPEGLGQLRLFKITYPKDGSIAFEMKSNLTDSMGDIGCVWTPEDLDVDHLYALWLSEAGTDYQAPSFAISPPWKVRKPHHQGMNWTTPVGIPIVVILCLYFISLGTCLVYRRRRRKQRERLKHAMEAEVSRPPTAADTIADTIAGIAPNSVSGETNTTIATTSFFNTVVRRPEQAARTPEKRHSSREVQRRGSMWDRNVGSWNDGFEGTSGIRLVIEDEHHLPSRESQAPLLSSPTKCSDCARRSSVLPNDLDVERIGEAL